MTEAQVQLEFVEEDDASLDASQIGALSQSVLYSADWTVETVLSQLGRQNIEIIRDFSVAMRGI